MSDTVSLIGSVVLYKDKLYKAIGASTQPEVILEAVEPEYCECGRELRRDRVSISPTCRNWQADVKPVKTIGQVDAN